MPHTFFIRLVAAASAVTLCFALGCASGAEPTATGEAPLSDEGPSSLDLAGAQALLASHGGAAVDVGSFELKYASLRWNRTSCDARGYCSLRADRVFGTDDFEVGLSPWTGGFDAAFFVGSLFVGSPGQGTVVRGRARLVLRGDAPAIDLVGPIGHVGYADGRDVDGTLYGVSALYGRFAALAVVTWDAASGRATTHDARPSILASKDRAAVEALTATAYPLASYEKDDGYPYASSRWTSAPSFGKDLTVTYAFSSGSP